MKNKLIVSMLAAMLIVGTTSVTAHAENNVNQVERTNTKEEEPDVPAVDRPENEEADAPAGTDEEPGTVDSPSTGNATITGDGESFTTVGDDDDKHGAADTDGSDVNVWGKVEEGKSHVYKVDIGWGAMKFEFNRSGVEWDTENHVYVSGEGKEAKWTVDEYLDGENNKITVTNHSNDGIKAKFTYAMEGSNAFNADSSSVDAVKGNFYTTNDEAKDGAKVLKNTAAVDGTLNENTIALQTAAEIKGVEGSANLPADARSEDAFFAFCGTPDVDGDGTLADFKKVGVINVTITPEGIPLAE